MKNIIPFPEKRMKRQKKLQKSETRSAVVAMSIASILLVAVVVNDHLSRDQRPLYIISDNPNTTLDHLNRAIASAQPMDPFRDLEWEAKLADKLAQTGRDPASDQGSIGRTVSSIDGLRFGPLGGKYHLDQSVNLGTGIRQIEYIRSDDVNDRPVFVQPDQFLKDYGHLLSVHFDVFDRSNPSQGHVQEYRLLNGKKKVVGRASFVLDDDGRLLSLRVASTPE
ncbi:MAG: hypothetical protein COT73_12540 [Bdellovibrio sp. CG10_big_fil_rev_8_21_14_0_10_47_8]|nr:MAG: hypothetical protein COT73_12540 [Bdellovibrio sp. CG10_big_fil_rev_8_21_14_0_10_47_8]